jgi:hypothetical protein
VGIIFEKNEKNQIAEKQHTAQNLWKTFLNYP